MGEPVSTALAAPGDVWIVLGSLLFVRGRLATVALGFFGTLAILYGVLSIVSASSPDFALFATMWRERELAPTAVVSFLPATLACAGLGVGICALLHFATRRYRVLPIWYGVLALTLLIGWALYAGHARHPVALPLRLVALAATPLPPEEPPWQRPALSPITPAQARHIVLIVDESVRGDRLSVNGYPRATAESLRGAINFGLASAAANCSAASNRLLQSGAQPRALDTRENLFAYAKRAGLRTVYVDGQHRERPLPPDVDERIVELGAVDRDLRVAARLNTLMRAPVPSFIYVNKAGAHYRYVDAYPPDAAVFQPDSVLDNAYDNAVRYAVHEFFARLQPPDDALVLYTSDHGQSLRVPGSHCQNESPPREQAVVPLLILASHAEALARSADVHRHRQSHFQIAPTLLWWMGYAPSAVRAHFGPDLREAAAAPRVFVSGDLRAPRLNLFDSIEVGFGGRAAEMTHASSSGRP